MASGTQSGKKVGRRPKLDEAFIARVCGQIKKGNTLKNACMAVGLGYSTFFTWKAQAEADRTAGKRSRFVDFLEAMEHAEAVAQQRLLSIVINEGGWKGAMEILKRRFPKEYGDKTALSNPDGTPLNTGGGPPINIAFTYNQPEGDSPWEIDPSALPPEPDPEEPTDPTPPTP